MKAAPLKQEAPLTDYERIRAQSMIRNNHMLRTLGVGTLATFLSKKTPKRKASARDDNDPLFQPGHEEYCSEEISEQDTNPSPITRNVKASKRVLAPEQSARMTRQRTREPSPTEEDELIPVSEPYGQIHMGIEDEPSASKLPKKKVLRLGRDLDRISRGLNSKIPVIVPEGKKRPEAPMQAAKLASEAGIALRNYIPILPHWKDYKNDKDMFEDYMGKVTGPFNIDTTKVEVKEACKDLLKSGQRQMRYKLKKAYFNGVPLNQVRKTSPLSTMTDDQWLKLVEMWSTPKHMDWCMANSCNRGNVQYHQTTGSRCYVAQVAALKQEKFKDDPPTAIDLFKACHFSSKTGFTATVQEAIDTMEGIAHPAEGQQAKDPTEAVAEVLTSSKFLENVGIQPKSMKRRSKATEDARVKEAQLEVEQQGAALVRQELDELKKKVAESEEARAKDVDKWEKESQETNALLRRLLNLKE